MNEAMERALRAELHRLKVENSALRAELKEADSAHAGAMSLWRETMEEVAKLQAERDALLAALKAVEPILARMYGQQAADLPPMKIVRAAIAKATGEAA